jgi:hypothetical protein
MDGQYLAKTLHDALKVLAMEACALTVKFEELPDKAGVLPCFSMQTLTGNPVERAYKDGSYIGNYRFAIYLRQSGEDAALSLDAFGAIGTLVEGVQALTLTLEQPYEFRGIRLDTLPVKVDVKPNYDDWQATFTMSYKKGR